MKKILSAIVKIMVVVLVVFSLIIATNAGYAETNQKSQKTVQISNIQTIFYANITFNVYEGEACDVGCIPLRGVTINATSRDIEHHITSAVTDDNGKCVLQLLYTTYRISFQEKDHEAVLFDFEVIGDQTFSFQTKKIETSLNYLSFAQMMLQKIILTKKLIT